MRMEEFWAQSVQEFDTRTLLKNASKQAAARNYADMLIVDADSHHYETDSFAEICDFIEDPVLRTEARFQRYGQIGIATAQGAYQNLAGRIPRVPSRFKEKTPPTPHRDITLATRWMDSLGVDIACIFPTAMLALSGCPRSAVEVGLARAYNRWLVDKVLAHEPRLKSMLYLPFSDPGACYRMVQDFGDKPGVLGFMITATHYNAVYDNAYVKTFAALEERGMPLAFHGGFTWGDRSLELTNRFIAVHALGFSWYNMLHMTNWLVNGLPERFPRLKVIWIESGLAWIPFLMQRLDNEFMMRGSDAPQLKRKPSDYMREMYYTTQPMEMVGNRKALQNTFEMINAETQLLYASDYPHWDMDVPSTIYDLPFLDEQAKRNILGLNACRVYGIDPARCARKPTPAPTGHPARGAAPESAMLGARHQQETM